MSCCVRERALPALVVDALVGVALLHVDAAVVLDVLEGVVHEAAVAAVVAVLRGAVDQVLLRERHQVPRLAEVLALERSRLSQRILFLEQESYKKGNFFQNLWSLF